MIIFRNLAILLSSTRTIGSKQTLFLFSIAFFHISYSSLINWPKDQGQTHYKSILFTGQTWKIMIHSELNLISQIYIKTLKKLTFKMSVSPGNSLHKSLCLVFAELRQNKHSVLKNLRSKNDSFVQSLKSRGHLLLFSK